MKILFTIKVLLLLTLVSFAHKETRAVKPSPKTNFKITPFQLTVYNEDYSMAYGLQYVLTEKSLKIIFQGQLQGEKDHIIFKTELQPSITLQKISVINIDKLQKFYINQNIRDGSQITVVLKKGRKSKTVHLSNYYQADIGRAIALINSLIPKKYQIWYDKEELLREQKKQSQVQPQSY